MNKGVGNPGGMGDESHGYFNQSVSHVSYFHLLADEND